KVAHAVSFDRDIALEAFAADGRKVVGAIKRSAGIELPADPLEQLLDAVALGGIERLATLEHHVFENMRGPGGAGHFVARPDLIGDLESDHRCGMIRHQQYGQTVAVESILVDSTE